MYIYQTLFILKLQGYRNCQKLGYIIRVGLHLQNLGADKVDVPRFSAGGDSVFTIKCFKVEYQHLLHLAFLDREEERIALANEVVLCHPRHILLIVALLELNSFRVFHIIVNKK